MITEIIEDAKNTNNFLDVETLQEVAEQNELEYILEPIQDQDSVELKNALITYINLNNYNLNKYIDKINELIIIF